MWLGASFTTFHAEGEGNNIGVKIVKSSQINWVKKLDLIKSIKKTETN